jgi:hypothetical protein
MHPGTLHSVTATVDTGSAPEPSSSALAHEHEWRLVAVEYDDLRVVRELRCEECDQTSYQ